MALLQVAYQQRGTYSRIVNLFCNRSMTSIQEPFRLNNILSKETDQSGAGPTRSRWEMSLKRFLHKTQHKLPGKRNNKQDGVPESYELICDTVIHKRYLFWLGGFAWVWSSTSAMVGIVGTAIVIFLVYYFPEKFPETLGGVKTAYAIAGTTLSLLLCVSVLHTLQLKRRLVTRIYHDLQTEEFIAVLRKSSYKTEKWRFKSREVAGKEETGWRGNFVIKGHPCLVCPEGFTKLGTIRFYNKWCGIE